MLNAVIILMTAYSTTVRVVISFAHAARTLAIKEGTAREDSCETKLL